MPGIGYCIKRFVGGGEHTHTFLVVALVLTWINEHTVVGSLCYKDGILFFEVMLARILVLLALMLVTANFPALSDLHHFLVAIACALVIPFCMIFHRYCTIALVCVLLLTLTELTCSRRPDEFKYYSGHGSVQCASWMTTDLLHLLRIDTVGTDSSLCLLSRPNLTAPFRVVRRGWNDSRDTLWGRPSLFSAYRIFDGHKSSVRCQHIFGLRFLLR